jgi:hypothetical protein
MLTTSPRDLAARLADLLRREHLAMADFLVELAEFDRRRCWLELGYASLFDFLHRELGKSKGTAFYRKVAAELIQLHPEVVEPLRDGRLCITAIHALSKAMTPENRVEVLPRFFNLSKQEARAVSAAMAPAPDVPRKDVVTTLRVPPPNNETSTRSSQPVGSFSLEGAEPAREPVPMSRPAVEPLTAAETRLHITVSPEFLDKLAAAKLALSHALPGAIAEDVLAAGLDLILARDAKKKALVANPRPPKAANQHIARDDSRHVPAEIRREVWTRDRGCCQWPLESGDICGSRLRPELDHVVPKARGGPTTVENLRVLCEFHNALAARKEFGNGLMDRFTCAFSRPTRGAGTSRTPPGW